MPQWQSWSRCLLVSLWLFQYLLPSAPNPCTAAPHCDCISMTGGDQPLVQVDCTHRNLSAIPNGRDFGAVLQLDFSWNQVTSLPAEAFRGWRLLKSGGFDGRLKLNFNPIWFIDDNAFWNLQAETLVLDLKYPNLSIFPSDALRNAPNLTGLYFWHSNIRNLPAGSFNGLSKLKKLDLTGNRLNYLEPGVFLGLEKSLESLTLRSMGLAEFPQAALRNLENLQELNLDENQITALRESALQSLATHHNLTLSLQHNLLSVISPHIFISGYFKLTSLQLIANSISDMSFLLNPCGHIYSPNVNMELTLNPLWCSCDVLNVLTSSFYVFRGECAHPSRLAGLSLNTDHNGWLPTFVKLQIESHCGNITEQHISCATANGRSAASGASQTEAFLIGSIIFFADRLLIVTYYLCTVFAAHML